MTSFPFPARATTRPYFDEMDGVEMSGYAIYRRIRFGPGSAALGAAIEAVVKLAARYERRQARIVALRDKMIAAWQGSAGDAAQSVLLPFLKVYDESLAKLKSARASLEAQAGSYQDTANKVMELPWDRPPGYGVGADAFAVDADAVLDGYRNNDRYNVALYEQYVTQSRANSAAMPQSYPTMLVEEVPPITIHRSTASTVPGWLSGQNTGVPADAAPGTGDGRRAGALALGGQPAVPSPEGQPGDSSGGSRQGGPLTQPSPGDAATDQQGWGPDPALARRWLAEGASGGSQGALPTMREPGGAGGFAGVGGTVGKLGALDHEAPGGRKSGAVPHTGVEDEVARRSVPRSGTSTGTGGVSGPGGGMWGAVPPRGRGEYETEHLPRCGRYLESDVFACDAPAWPAVIGAEFDEDDEEKDR